jgi:hypothetical protein
MKVMIGKLSRLALRHRGIVTTTLVLGLLINLLVIGQIDPPDGSQHGDLPLASHCQGGGPGCATQPMIPPPVGGLPHFDAPPPPVFGALVLIQPAVPAALHESPPPLLDPPPIADSIA